MKTIGLIANCGKKRAPDVLRRLAAQARKLDLELLCDESTGNLLKAVKAVPPKEMFDRVEAVIALGGDGTMLRVVRELDGRDKPVIGVNIGGLGFLTSVAEEELDRALKCLAEDDFVVKVRAVAESVVLRGNTEIARYRALNDVVVGSGSSSRVVTLDVSIE